MWWGATSVVVKRTSKRSSRGGGASQGYCWSRAAMVCKKATGAVDCGHARGDGLMQRQRSGVAVMGGRCLKLFSVLSLSLFALSVGDLFLLLQGAMALLVYFSVAIEGAASAVEALGVHDASRPVKGVRLVEGAS